MVSEDLRLEPEFLLNCNLGSQPVEVDNLGSDLEEDLWPQSKNANCDKENLGNSDQPRPP